MSSDDRFEQNLNKPAGIVPTAGQMADKRPVVPSRAAVSVRSTTSMTITALGIQVTGDVTEDEWEGLVENALHGEKSLSWGLGDLFVIGADKQWGAYKRFASKHHIEWRRLEDYAYVCRKVDYSVRTEKLSFSHHRLVAPYFDPANIETSREFQRQVLAGAIEKEMSVDELRAALQALEGKQLSKPLYITGGVLDKEHKNRFNKLFRDAMQDPANVDMVEVMVFDAWWQDFKKHIKTAKK